MTNIAFWTPNSLKYMGGGAKWILQASALLQKRGHYVEVFALPLSLQESSNSSIIGKPMDIVYHETWGPTVRGFDVVYMMYNPLWRLCKVRHAKSVAGIHSPLWYSKMEELASFAEPSDILTLFCGKAYYSIFGELDLRFFKKVHIINPVARINHDDVAFVPNWIDTEFWRPSIVKEDRFSALFVGRRNLEKGWDLYVKTAESLKKSCPNIEFYATGTDYGVIKGINFPNEEDMPQTYSRFHILTVPARLNVFPLTFLESLSCGTPVVTLPISTHVSLFKLGLPMLFGNSYASISKLVRRVYSIWINYRERYTAMCTSARQAASRFDVREVFPRFEKMLMEM
jgi:glycosyltransferase involved in cell wall biosynthesis